MEEPTVIDVQLQPLSDNSSLRWVELVTPVDCLGLVKPTYDSTNTVSFLPISTSPHNPTRVDRGIEYMITHYEDLLRRLAD